MPDDHSAAPATEAIWNHDSWIKLTQLLLNSYEHWKNQSLIPRSSPAADSRLLFEAPFVVVAHGTEADPLLNYGNQSALQLWKLALSDFLGTPSRETAEPVHRDERSALLKRTREFGFIDDYSGVRIASDGQRFTIHQATVWNVVNENQQVVGQAAAFAHWTPLNQASLE
jgi:hypothetical protein